MSSPSGPATTYPAILALFTRMQAKGLTETITVYERAPLVDSVTNQPVGRALTEIGAFEGWVPEGGGTVIVAQEGQRQSATFQVYYPNTSDVAALLNGENQAMRWVKRGNGDPRVWRIMSYIPTGPYIMLTIESGATTDKAGNVR